MTTERQFSIMASRVGAWFKPIPWRVLATHEKQALINHSQSLERLHQRGGLDPYEALHVLLDLRWDYSEQSKQIRALTIDEADRQLRELVAVREQLYVPTPVVCNHGDRPAVVDARGVEKCPNCGTLVNGTATGRF